MVVGAGAFAGIVGLGLFLSAAGIFALMSVSVSRRLTPLHRRASRYTHHGDRYDRRCRLAPALGAGRTGEGTLSSVPWHPARRHFRVWTAFR